MRFNDDFIRESFLCKLYSHTSLLKESASWQVAAMYWHGESMNMAKRNYNKNQSIGRISVGNSHALNC